MRHPLPTLLAGVVFFGGLAFGSPAIKRGGFGGNTNPPAGSDSAVGQSAADQALPAGICEPDQSDLQFQPVGMCQPGALATITAELRASSLFSQVTGPLNPVGGITLTPAQYAELCGALGPRSSCRRPMPPDPGGRIPAQAYQLYRATGNYVSADGRTVQFSVGLAAGDPGNTPALHAVPASERRQSGWHVGRRRPIPASAGEAPALYDISTISTSDLKKIIPIAILAIGLLLAIVLRSLSPRST